MRIFFVGCRQLGKSGDIVDLFLLWGCKVRWMMIEMDDYISASTGLPAPEILGVDSG